MYMSLPGGWDRLVRILTTRILAELLDSGFKLLVLFSAALSNLRLWLIFAVFSCSSFSAFCARVRASFRCFLIWSFSFCSSSLSSRKRRLSSGAAARSSSSLATCARAVLVADLIRAGIASSWISSPQGSPSHGSLRTILNKEPVLNLRV